jgi:hypothetical protein
MLSIQRESIWSSSVQQVLVDFVQQVLKQAGSSSSSVCRFTMQYDDNYVIICIYRQLI